MMTDHAAQVAEIVSLFEDYYYEGSRNVTYVLQEISDEVIREILKRNETRTGVMIALSNALGHPGWNKSMTQREMESAFADWAMLTPQGHVQRVRWIISMLGRPSRP